MGLEVEAIYEDGLFVLLSPIALVNGTKVTLAVKEEEELEEEVTIEDDEDLEVLPPFRTIKVDWKGGLTASQMIIEERGEL